MQVWNASPWHEKTLVVSAIAGQEIDFVLFG